MKIVCWNMKWNSNHEQAWAMLRAMDADIALLQKARKPPAGVDDWAEVNPEPWRIEGRTVQWRSAVARLSDLIDVEWIASKSIAQAGPTISPSAGPQAPSGRQPTSRDGRESRDVLTFYTPREGKPEKATQQLDFVFATPNIANRISVRALNEVEEWGPSDHCRILVELPSSRRLTKGGS